MQQSVETMNALSRVLFETSRVEERNDQTNAPVSTRNQQIKGEGTFWRTVATRGSRVSRIGRGIIAASGHSRLYKKCWYIWSEALWFQSTNGKSVACIRIKKKKNSAQERSSTMPLQCSSWSLERVCLIELCGFKWALASIDSSHALGSHLAWFCGFLEVIRRGLLWERVWTHLVDLLLSEVT